MKFIIKTIENVLFVTAVLIMACSLMCQIIGLKPVVVLSGSMEPAIKTGSLAFIDTSDRDVFVGDVISFRAGNLLVSHRVIEITEQGYKTKGDNNDVADAGIVKDSCVEGKILFSVPGAGYFLKTAAVPAGMVIILLYMFMKVIYRRKRL
jgi:signal peptidase